MFKKLKQFGQALSPDNIKQGLAASREILANGGQLTEEQLARMTPEQRAQVEAALLESKVAAQRNADQVIEAERARRVLSGPAGEYLYGPLPDRERLTDMSVRGQLEAAKAELKATIANPWGKTPPPPPVLRAPVSDDRDQQEAHERAQREEARTPYLAADRTEVVFTRIATEPKDSVEELCGWLGSSGLSARPDLVYGVHRVPDHLPGKVMFGRTSVVEWEIVHASVVALPPAPPATAAVFDARETWVTRRAGEPSILDEDLALEFFRNADLGPEQCLGIARRIRVEAARGSDGNDGGGSPSYVMVGPDGVLALHPAARAVGAFERTRGARPLQAAPAPGVWIETLNWADIRKVVAPRTDQRHLIPSPFPYLPSTPQELLQSYLAIVGVNPRDSYSAQVTVSQPVNVIGGRHGAFVSVNGPAEAEEAADGKQRKRYRGATRIVIAYRDAPQYVEGRARWASYQSDVMFASLQNGFAVRPPLHAESALDRGVLGSLASAANVVGSLADGTDINEPFHDVPQFRYCWPPVR